ncbi:MAG: IS256 family transposase [Candidatus Hydrothermarchaeota archaeon]
MTRDTFDEELKKHLKNMMQLIMEKERTGFLGYEKGKPIVSAGAQRKNHRNGHYEREFLSSLGLMEDLKVPRDRAGEFYPKLLEAIELRSGKVEDLIVAMYSKGLSTRDIGDIVEKIYGDSISAQTVSNLATAISEEREAWEDRPLKPRYIAIFIDCFWVKIRRDVVNTDAVYIIGGIDQKGQKDILSIHVGATESAVVWEEHLQNLKDRGVQEVLEFVSDGLTGLKDAIKRKFPEALTQRCVVHQVRGTMGNVRNKHKAEMVEDLRTIYRVDSQEEAKKNLKAIRDKWKKFYPRLFNSWEEHIEDLMAHLSFPKFLRKYLYTTNWIERVNKELRKMVKTKNSLPTEDAAKNLLYYKVKDLTYRYEQRRVPGFDKYKPELEEMWKKQYPYSTLHRKL